MRFRPVFAVTLCWGACSLSGCQNDSYTPQPEPVLYPVKGKVTAEGKPLAHAVVTFLQVDAKGTTSVGETDDEGVYELSHVMKPGTAAAAYKVSISYLEGKDGTVYGLAPRSGLSKPYGMITAKERIPPEWSDLGRTRQRVTVPENGGTFNFEIKEPLLPPPIPDTPAKGDTNKATSEVGTAKTSEPPVVERNP
jgi:hypothetical protein